MISTTRVCFQFLSFLLNAMLTIHDYNNRMINKIFQIVRTVLTSNQILWNHGYNRFPWHTCTGPLTFLSWHRDFSKEKKWRVWTSIMDSSLPFYWNVAIMCFPHASNKTNILNTKYYQNLCILWITHNIQFYIVFWLLSDTICNTVVPRHIFISRTILLVCTL